MELIKISENNGKKLVSGRELHKFLESKERFSKWFDKMLEFGFELNEDYTPYQMVHPQNKQEITDFAVNINMAKELSMVSRLPKGKEARRYFIECEKKMKDRSPKTYKEALLQLIEAEEEKERLIEENAIKQQVILEYEPKVDYYDAILKSEGLLTVTQIAKDYGLSGTSLNKILHKESIQYKQSSQWLLYSDHANKGYTKSSTHVDSTGTARLNTKWTQKGRLMIHELLKSNGVIAIMDR